MQKIILSLGVYFLLFFCNIIIAAKEPVLPVLYSYRIVNSFPHDFKAFTQGLFYQDGFIYESTGLYGRSSLRQINLTSGKSIKQIELPEVFFGEGIAACNGRIILLTWRERRGLVYDLESFSLVETFSYQTEGWGLTYDGKYLIMSDGSSILTFLDPKTFTRIKQIQVTSNGRPVVNLNELEFVKGKIYANIWQTDYIGIIDPATGQITGWIDLSGLLDPKSHRGHFVDVLNGIAYDQENDRLFVTGKLWPKIFEIKIVLAEKK